MEFADVAGLGPILSEVVEVVEVSGASHEVGRGGWSVWLCGWVAGRATAGGRGGVMGREKVV